MIIELDFEVFHLKYFNQNTIFVKELEDGWDMYTYEGIVIIHTKKFKSIDTEENIMFVDRYLSSVNANILKVNDIVIDSKKEEEIEGGIDEGLFLPGEESGI